jgi:hypothetical protein
MFKENEKLLNYSTNIPKKIKSIKLKNALIGGDDLYSFIELPREEFIKKIKELYPNAYENLKQGLELYDKTNGGLDMDKYLKEEMKKPVFFNNSFLKKLIKLDGEPFLKTRLKLLFMAINKNLKGQITIPSETVQLGETRVMNKGVVEVEKKKESLTVAQVTKKAKDREQAKIDKEIANGKQITNAQKFKRLNTAGSNAVIKHLYQKDK